MLTGEVIRLAAGTDLDGSPMRAGKLLPTPRPQAHGGGGLMDDRDRLNGPNLATAVGRIFPEPGALGDEIDWAEYEPAIRRWEAIHGPAPCPVEPGKNGKPRLAAVFAEWMMGLPAGWVTGVPGLSRGAQLKAIGNGVVPHQAAMAVAALYQPVESEEAA
jgi:DNA (cytosine-5)-methyltransferase 1